MMTETACGPVLHHEFPVCGKDYAGMWYAARLRRGISDRMWFYWQEEGEVPACWHTVSHQHHDGIGAMRRLLQKHGHEVPEWPVFNGSRKYEDEFSSVEKRVLQRQRCATWRHPASRQAVNRPPALLILGVERTAQVDEVARSVGVSPTTWLHWTADRATRHLLCRYVDILSWVYPVNLRGSVQCSAPEMNHCGGLGLHIDGMDSAPDLQRQVALRLAQGEHWKSWRQMTAGRWLGRIGVDLLYGLLQQFARPHAGSYSNLGRWDVPGITAISCCAPGSPNYPVSVGTVLCNGRRTLSCRLHPVIGGSAELERHFLMQWQHLLLSPEAR